MVVSYPKVTVASGSFLPVDYKINLKENQRSGVFLHFSGARHATSFMTISFSNKLPARKIIFIYVKNRVNIFKHNFDCHEISNQANAYCLEG